MICDWATPDWLSAAEKLGLAISAAMLGCAASAAHAFWFDDNAASAAECLLTAANADGLAIIAAEACGLARTACIAEALILPAAAAEAASELAWKACNAFDALASCAELAMLEKAEALRPIAESACGFSMCALLARLAKAAELALIAENTRGSALSAFIAMPSLASFWNAWALFAKRALFAADEANLEKAAESFANRPK